jgi:L-lactate dehydrogenase complex protein LldG
MSAARDEILGRVRAALGGAARPEIVVARDYRRSADRGKAELVELLAERISDYRATVHRTDQTGLREVVGAICRERGVRRLGVPPALPPDCRPDGVELVEDHGLSAQELDGLDGVLTGSALAIAETGTLVLAGGERDGRRALSLVPDVHICLVDGAQVVELVPEAIALLGARVVSEQRPLTFISGPSATSDIELDRVEGVHGPRILEVVIVTGTAS